MCMTVLIKEVVFFFLNYCFKNKVVTLLYLRSVSVLNYVPRLPSCPTYLRALRAHVPYVRALIFLRALPALIFLRTFIFLRVLRALVFLRALRVFIFLRAYILILHADIFSHKLMNLPMIVHLCYYRIQSSIDVCQVLSYFFIIFFIFCMIFFFF